MKAATLLAVALATGSITVSSVTTPAVAAVSGMDLAASIAQDLIKSIQSFGPTAPVSLIEGRLALVLEGWGSATARVGDDVVVMAIDSAEALPGISANAKIALENLKRLHKRRKHGNYIGALGGGDSGSYGGGGPGFVGGGGSDYRK